MIEPLPSDGPTPIVHGLLICRNVEMAQDGGLNLQKVLEVVALDSIPGDAGPLTFVAFLRGIPPGKASFTFVIRPSGDRESVVAHYPLEVEIQQGFADRQVALHVHVASAPVPYGGWFDVSLEWNGRTLGMNRFAIGQTGTGPVPPTDEA